MQDPFRRARITLAKEGVYERLGLKIGDEREVVFLHDVVDTRRREKYKWELLKMYIMYDAYSGDEESLEIWKKNVGKMLELIFDGLLPVEDIPKIDDTEELRIISKAKLEAMAKEKLIGKEIKLHIPNNKQKQDNKDSLSTIINKLNKINR